MLDIENLSFSYGKNVVLKDINFSANNGELIFLLGKNGAGKSTLIKCLLCVFKNYTGVIKINGEDTRNLSARDMSKNISYMPQLHYQAFNYSVFDVVLMGTTNSLSALKQPKEEQMQRVDDALEKIGITHLKDKMFLNLSGGERQLVLIARSLAQNTNILIMDEPTSGLDFGNQFKILSVVKSLTDTGYIVILSSHNPQHALDFSDRTVALNNGKIYVAGKTKEVLNANVIKELYGVDTVFEKTRYGTVIICK